MPADIEWIRDKAARTIHPSQVATILERLAAIWPAHAPALQQSIEHFSLGEAALLHLISVSSICAARIAQDPAALLWLQHPDVCNSSRGTGRMRADLQPENGLSIAADNFLALRLWKGREMLRISLREIAEVAPLEETTLELTQLAEICLAEVFGHWNRELRARRGSPSAHFAVFGLGKLGGRELNHSSDIDLIFLYSEEGQLSPNFTYHEWFNQLAGKITETFATKHSAGALFRIDLRLRPEGSAGPLARSLDSMENYYSGFGETWERLALIKAREVAGDAELAYEFLRRHQTFIYPRSASTELLDEIASVKNRIERDIVGHDHLNRNVKLGVGGIREIEFVVQALQLLHGARHAFLQDTSTLKLLPSLAELELLPRAEAVALDAAYRFLRRVEHRLQIEAEQQTHSIPDEPETEQRLALSLGFGSTEEFFTALQTHTQTVRAVFRRVISESERENEAAPEEIFRNAKASEKALTELAQGRTSFHVAPRTRQVFRKLRPLLVSWLARSADPDGTLNQFTRFVDAYGLRSMLFELLVANPKLLELLVKTFDASRAAGDLLIRRPQLLEDMTRGGTLDRAISVADHLERLDEITPAATNLDPVRAYRQRHLLRILLRDVLRLTEPASLFAEHSALAEACLLFANRRLGSGETLTVIAMGKFGGSEMSYGADLDVLFVADDVRAAQILMVEMTRPSAEGIIAVLDPRLRPEGEKGLLVCSVESYAAYYANRAQLWELQALTRARPIAGPAQTEFETVAQGAWHAAGQRPDLFQQIGSMRARIQRDRGTGNDYADFKTGTGGIIEAEFLVQALQLRSGTWNTAIGGAIADLSKAGVLREGEGKRLKSSYEFLRSCESTLRRWENKSVSVFPTDEVEQQRLIAGVGAVKADVFREEYLAARETIHDLYSAYFA